MEKKPEVKQKLYKVNCGFMKLGCCSFKPEDCRPEKCDMYHVEFTSKSLRKEIKKLKDKIKELVATDLKMKKIKSLVKLEKENRDHAEVVAYKKKLMLIKDYGKGLEYLEKAYRHLKRCGK